MRQEYRAPVHEMDRVKAGLARHLVAASLGVPVEAMAPGLRRGTTACRARWLALYLAHVSYGWTLERVAHVFGVNRATAGVACRWSEEQRDRPQIDALLDTLEGQIAVLFALPRCDLPA